MRLNLFTLCFFCFLFINAQNEWFPLGENIVGDQIEDQLGYSVSLNSSGGIIAVGSPLSDENGVDSGKVKIYVLDNFWVQIGEDINGNLEGGRFGNSVSINSEGNIVAIGANGFGSGLVKVYRNENDSWVQIGEDIIGENEGDNFGISVSINSEGNIVAIGSPNNQSNFENSGLVKVYRNENDSWIQVGEDIVGENEGDNLGTSVSINSEGNILAIGVPHFKASSNYTRGQVKVYRNENDSWVQSGEDINGPDGNGFQDFGYSVSINSEGNTIGVGVPNSYEGEVSTSQVRVYRNINNNWIQHGNTILGDIDSAVFGHSVSINAEGNVIAGGDFVDGNGVRTGLVKVFKKFNNDEWKQVGEDVLGDYSIDLFGFSVSLSDDAYVLASGGILGDLNGTASGHVKVYVYIGSTLSLNNNELIIKAFKLYPNPTAEKLNVAIPEVIIQKISIYTLNGSLVLSENFNESEINIPVQNLSSSNYIVKIKTDKGEISKQFVKE